MLILLYSCCYACITKNKTKNTFILWGYEINIGQVPLLSFSFNFGIRKKNISIISDFYLIAVYSKNLKDFFWNSLIEKVIWPRGQINLATLLQILMWHSNHLDEEWRFLYDCHPATAIISVTIWPGGPHSPFRIITQVQWFMYHNRLEPSRGILHW